MERLYYWDCFEKADELFFSRIVDTLRALSQVLEHTDILLNHRLTWTIQLCALTG